MIKNGFMLVREDGTEVNVGDPLMDFRGEQSKLVGGNPPHKPSSSGFVWGTGGRECYPQVYNLKWKDLRS